MALSLLLTSLLPLFGAFPTEVSGQMLYLLHKGETQRAFANYLSYADENQAHDFSLLQQAGIRLLEQGIASDDLEIQLMCMFGAGVSISSELLPILEKGVHSKDLKTQLVALSYLGRQQDDAADLLLLEALGSPFLIARLEALLQLAQKNHPAVMGHLHSLIVKLPDPIRVVFPQIAIHLEGIEATRFMRQLLNNACVEVRQEAILSVAKARRDDLLPSIRMLASNAHHAQQECCAIALGTLKDYQSINKLKELAESVHENVQLAASTSLYELGETEYLQPILTQARSGSLFAISALGKLKMGTHTLFYLMQHPDRDIRLNATLALFNRGDERALQNINEILLEDQRDTGFARITSPGGGLKAWKTIASASAHEKDHPGIQAQTHGLREQVLTHCIEFEEAKLLELAQLVFDQKLGPLIPLLMELLQNKKSDSIIEFLKKGQQRAGDPLVRNYCTLTLYKLHEPGDYEQQLIDWAKAKGNTELIRFKEDKDSSSLSKSHQLTPEETSRFLIETFEALASTQSQAGIDSLIHAIAYGNPKNRYALVGLLMRTTE